MIIKIKKFCEKYHIDWKIIKFLVVGSINTFFGYLVFAFFIFIGVYYPVANFLSTVIGILFNFKTNGVLVFNSHDNSLIFKFFLTYGITWVFGTFLLYILKHFNISLYIGGILVLVPNAVVSFTLMKYFVFKKNRIVTTNDCANKKT